MLVTEKQPPPCPHEDTSSDFYDILCPLLALPVPPPYTLAVHRFAQSCCIMMALQGAAEKYLVCLSGFADKITAANVWEEGSLAHSKHQISVLLIMHQLCTWY